MAAALVLGEIICRVAVPAPPPLRYRQVLKELRDARCAEALPFLQPDRELFWTPKPGQRGNRAGGTMLGVISNQKGLREDHEIRYGKPRGQVRVLFLGDSCTFGYGVYHTNAYPQQVESFLRRALPGRSIECLNAGVIGYSALQGWRYLETEGWRYEPDVVVACFGWNDQSTFDSRSDIEHYLLQDTPPLPWPLRWSRMASLAASARHSEDRAGPGPLRPRLNPREFASVFRRLRETSAERGAMLIPVIWAMRNQSAGAAKARPRSAWQQVLLDYGMEEDLFVVDTIPLMRALAEKHGAQALYLDSGHVTAGAHSAIAVAVSGAILRRLQPAVPAGTPARRPMAASTSVPATRQEPGAQRRKRNASDAGQLQDPRAPGTRNAAGKPAVRVVK